MISSRNLYWHTRCPNFAYHLNAPANLTISERAFFRLYCTHNEKDNPLISPVTYPSRGFFSLKEKARRSEPVLFAVFSVVPDASRWVLVCLAFTRGFYTCPVDNSAPPHRGIHHGNTLANWHSHSQCPVTPEHIPLTKSCMVGKTMSNHSISNDLNNQWQKLIEY